MNRTRRDCIWAPIITLLLLVARPASAADPSYFYFNIDGHTSLRITNPDSTDVPIIVPGNLGAPSTVAAHSTLVVENWMGAGNAGFAPADLPAPLKVATQVTDSTGAIVRIGAIESFVAGAQLQDLVAGADQFAFVVFGTRIAGNAGVYDVNWLRGDQQVGGQQIIVPAGSVAGLVVPVPFGATRAVIAPCCSNIGAGGSLPPPPFYTFAFLRRLSGRYELQGVIYATSVP